MVGLLDIAPLSQKVKVGDKTVEVKGVSALGIAKLLAKFPELRMLMSGNDDELNIGVEELFKIVPEAIASIIAAGCGYPGDEKAEAIAASLPAEQQVDLLGPILKLTMPKGARPFFEKLQAAMVGLGGDDLAKIVATQSPQPSKSSSGTATN